MYKLKYITIFNSMNKRIEQFSSQSQITLGQALYSLAIRITTKATLSEQSKIDKLTLLIKLLKRIDDHYFQPRLSTSTDYEQLLKTICDYYSDQKQEKIKKLFIIENSYKNKFIHIFELIMDLALNSNNEKDIYLNEMLGMEEREKELLMPFVDEVMKRQFIQKMGDMFDSLLEIKEQEYQQLRQNFQQLYHNYYELLQTHNNIKAINEKLMKQNNEILQQKQDLMSELGLQTNSSFIQIAQKYHNDLQQYELFIEKLNKQLEEKKTMLKQKNQQIEEMTANITILDESTAEIHEHIKKNEELEKLALTLTEKESKAKQEIDNYVDQVQTLKKEIEDKDFQISQLNYIKSKYQQIKEVHRMFKRKFQAKIRSQS